MNRPMPTDTPVITIEDNLYAVARGAYKRIDDCLTYRPKGYAFSSAYQMFKDSGGSRGWDGKTHLAKQGENGIRFPAGLLQYVLDDLSQYGVVPDVVDHRMRPAPSVVTFASKPQIEVEQHQEEALDGAEAQGRGIIYYPTASGKSVIIGELIRRLRVPTLVLVDKKDLLKQLHGVIQQLTGAPVGIIGGGRWEPGTVTVATIQSITAKMRFTELEKKTMSLKQRKERKRLALEFLAQYQCLIIDETHHAESDTFSEVMEACSGAYYRFGFSATPFKGEEKGTLLNIMAWTGPVATYLSISRGIDTGRLVPCDIFCVEYPRPAVPKDELPANYKEEVDRLIVACPERNDTIIRIAERVRDAGPTVILVERIEHGEIFASTLKSAFVHGGVPGKERTRMWEEFRDNNTDLLVVSKIGDEGLDLPNLEFLILAAGGKANHRQIQRIGRGMRASDGKDHVTIFDFQDVVGMHLPSHYRRRRRLYDGERAYQVADLSVQQVKEMFG